MSQLLIRFRNLIIIVVAIAISLIDFNTHQANAHVPHDDVYSISLSTNYQQDRTVFIIVRGNLFKSTDGGKNWQRLVNGIDHHGNLVALTIASENPQILYLSALTDGIYKSENGGESWEKINRGLEDFQIGLLSTNGDGSVILAAGSDRGLYYSHDGGKNWHTAIADRQITAIGINPHSSTDWLVGDIHGLIYGSEDRGQTWQLKTQLTQKNAINAIAFSPRFNTDRTVYIGTDEEGVLRSTNAGKNFTFLNLLEQDNLPIRVKDIVIANLDDKNIGLYVSDWNQGVFYSSNEGQTWQKYTQGLTKDSQADQKNFLRPHFNDLAISPNFVRDKTLFLTGFDGLFKSQNRGKTWQEIDSFTRSIIGLVISPDYQEDGTVAVLNYVGEAYLSRDRAQTWQPLYRGLELPRFTSDFKQPKVEPRRFFQLAISPNYSQDRSIFATILWSKFLKCNTQTRRWQINSLPQEARSLAIAISPDYERDKIIYLVGQRGIVFISDNRGKSFTKLAKLEGQKGNESPFLVISPNFANDKTLFVTGKQGVYKSTDGGKSWQVTTENTELQEGYNLKLAISPNYQNDSTLLVSSGTGLFITQDGGKNWRKLVSDRFEADAFLTGVALSPNYAEDKTFFINVRGKGLFKTTDRGTTFEPVGDSPIDLALLNNFESSTMPIQISPNFTNDETIYGIGTAGSSIFQSTDAGKTWQLIDIPQAEIFQQYTARKYNRLTLVQLYWYIYQSKIIKVLAVLIAASMAYIVINKFYLEKKLPLSKLQLQILSCSIVLAIAVIILKLL